MSESLSIFLLCSCRYLVYVNFRGMLHSRFTNFMRTKPPVQAQNQLQVQRRAREAPRVPDLQRSANAQLQSKLNGLARTKIPRISESRHLAPGTWRLAKSERRTLKLLASFPSIIFSFLILAQPLSGLLLMASNATWASWLSNGSGSCSHVFPHLGRVRNVMRGLSWHFRWVTLLSDSTAFVDLIVPQFIQERGWLYWLLGNGRSCQASAVAAHRVLGKPSTAWHSSAAFLALIPPTQTRWI